MTLLEKFGTDTQTAVFVDLFPQRISDLTYDCIDISHDAKNTGQNMGNIVQTNTNSKFIFSPDLFWRL